MGSFGNKESKLVLVVVVCFFSLKAIVIILIWSRGLTGGERTVKRLRLSKAITVPATTTIYDACKNMASRKVDALLLTDSNEMLCGILTDRVISHYHCSKQVTNKKTKTIILHVCRT